MGRERRVLAQGLWMAEGTCSGWDSRRIQKRTWPVCPGNKSCVFACRTLLPPRLTTVCSQVSPHVFT